MALTDSILNKTVTNIDVYFTSSIPDEFKIYLTFAIFTIIITLYGMFVWKFYRFLARRDILELNLNQYNRSTQEFVQKTLAVILYILEYIIILPVLVFFWFFVMAMILLLLARDLQIESIALIAACIVGAVRITSYYSEDLSKDLAKLFPFTILSIALVTPGFFDFPSLISKIVEINVLFFNIIVYLLVIMVLEFLLRMLELLTPESFEQNITTKDNISV